MSQVTKIAYLVISLATGSVCSFAQDSSKSINDFANERDCKNLGAERNASAEAYSAYVVCELDNNHRNFESIYVRNLRKYPEDETDATVIFNVELSGKIEEINVHLSDVKSDRLTELLVARLRIISLLPPEKNSQEIVYKFQFKSNGK